MPLDYLPGQQELFSVTKLTPNPKCTGCRLHKTTDRVCILGKYVKTDIMIIGEAPGANEERTGELFSGQAGQLLEEVLEDVGIDREDVFICNAVSCRPPNNKTPTKSEIKSCHQWLKHQIAVIKPKYVLLLGNTPLQSITGAAGIKKARGRPFEKDGIVYLPTYHPAFILRDDANEPYFTRDLKLFSTIIEEGGIPREKNLDIVIVDTHKKFEQLLRDLRGTVSLDIETTGLYPWAKDAAVTALGFGTRKHQYIIPMEMDESPWTRADREEMLDELDSYLRDCFLVMHNGKFDCLYMMVLYGVFWHEYLDFDTMLAHYLIDENARHGLKLLAQVYCGAPDWDVDADTKKGHKGLAKQSIYHAHDLYYTRELRFVLGRLLDKDGDIKRVFEHLMMPVARLFTEVEYDGVHVEAGQFNDAEEYLRKTYNDSLKLLKEHEPKQWKDPKGGPKEFSWGSPQDLGRFFFGKRKDGGLGLEIIEKTKTGNPSCNESVVKRLDHPCVDALLKFREAKQQLSFFIDGWKPFLHRTSTGVYLHPSFKLHGTVTGRPSCEDPNLQQVPRDERIRSLITAPKGWTFMDADLSQIELRIAAELANEKTLLKVFKEGGDPHWTTAINEIARGGAEGKLVLRTAQVWLKKNDPTRKNLEKLRYSDAIDVLLEMGADAAVEINKAWKELRKKAKAVNFGYLYGMWWKKFKAYARDNYGVTVTDEEAQASREGFFATYSRFEGWHDRQRRYARMNGYVRTFTGRKRRLPQAQNSENEWDRKEAERKAINSPVQGFAAELNLMVALQLRREFPRRILRIVGTVHDSILMWVKQGHELRVAHRVKEIMRRPDLFDVFEIELGVPIEGDVAIGPWGKGISLEKWEKQYGPLAKPAGCSKDGPRPVARRRNRSVGRTRDREVA